MVMSGEHNDDADVNRGGRVTLLDAVMFMQAAVERIEIGQAYIS
jgi:hypothetical protein